MEYKSLPIDELRPDPKNARIHDERNIEAIAASLDEFGQQKPIVVDPDGNVLAGHGTLAAAKQLGWVRLNCIVSDLEGPLADAYRLADNRTAELAGWDRELLGGELEALSPGLQASAGFLQDEIEDLLRFEALETDPDDLDEGSNAKNTKPIIVTPDQRETIDEAIRAIRTAEGDMSIKEGRCVELICADYLSGIDYPEG